MQFWETVVPEWVYAVIINTPFKKSENTFTHYIIQ